MGFGGLFCLFLYILVCLHVEMIILKVARCLVGKVDTCEFNVDSYTKIGAERNDIPRVAM